LKVLGVVDQGRDHAPEGTEVVQGHVRGADQGLVEGQGLEGQGHVKDLGPGNDPGQGHREKRNQGPSKYPG